MKRWVWVVWLLGIMAAYGNPVEMVHIPSGYFQMGDTFGEGSSDELPVHSVHVSGFYMDKYEVTKALGMKCTTGQPITVMALTMLVQARRSTIRCIR